MPSDRADTTNASTDAAATAKPAKSPTQPGAATDAAAKSSADSKDTKDSKDSKDSKSAPPTQHEGNIKETIESILVAFILAFVFRAFVVEAFVIPTGSMAPTLMGAHMRYRCLDCGYGWDVNFSSGRGGGDDINIPSSAAGVVPPLHCPNCGFPVREVDSTDADNDRTNPDVHYGDRILVLKYLYLFQKPERWDVVVFKSPADYAPKNGEPVFGQNYIKRLVGNPNETIVILDGDVYKADGPLPFLPGKARQPDGSADVGDVDWSKFAVQRKPWYVQEALWRNVYDNDYLPHLARDKSAVATEDKTPWKQPWQEANGGKGWQTGSTPDDKTGRSRVFQFANPSAASTLYFDAEAVPNTHGLTDYLAYDEPQPGVGGNPVGDLKLSLFYTRQEGDGPLELTLSKPAGESFTARITRGQLTVFRGRDGMPAEQVRPPIDVPALRSADPVRLEFCNVDYRVSLRVDGQEVFATSDKEYGPNVKELAKAESTRRPERGSNPWDRGLGGDHPRAAQITAAGQRCRVEHLALSRDIYYLTRYTWGQGGPYWGDPERPIELGAEEYFVLGDNSFISGDARTWTDFAYAADRRFPQPLIDLPDENLIVQNGRVPGRFMLGKAFFVYWPAGYRPTRRLPFGIIPNFGDMRFIH